MVALLEGPGGNLRKELYPESGWEAIETRVIAWFFTTESQKHRGTQLLGKTFRF